MHAIAITDPALDLIATNNGGMRPRVRTSPYANGCAADYFILPTNPNDHAQIINTDVFFEMYEFVGPESPTEFRPIRPLSEENTPIKEMPLTVDSVFVDFTDAVFLDAVEIHVPETAQVVDIQRAIGKPGASIYFQYNSDERQTIGSRASKTWRIGVIGDGAAFSSASRHQATVIVEGRAWHLIDVESNMDWAPCC